MTTLVPASMTAEGLTAAGVAAAAAAANVKLSGDVVQVVNTIVSSVATGVTVLPVDDTIPQITEGTEFMTLAITPTSASNILLIDVVAHIGNNTGGSNGVALFQDSTANALSAVAVSQYGVAGAIQPVAFRHRMVAGTASATTFRVRAGPGAAVTLTFNGVSGGRFMGGVLASSITITEIKA